MDGTGHISCCVRSILTNGGVLSSDGTMLIGIGEGTAQIGRILVEIPRFLFLKIFHFYFGCLWMVLDISRAVFTRF